MDNTYDFSIPTFDDRANFAKEVNVALIHKANKMICHYVVCFFVDAFGKLASRSGFFESENDASFFASTLDRNYRVNKEIKYYIMLNNDVVYDGGFFNVD